MNRLQQLAKKCLKTYRIWRGMGYTPKQARAIAHFTITTLSGGRKNVYAENLLRRYNH